MEIKVLTFISRRRVRVYKEDYCMYEDNIIMER